MKIRKLAAIPALALAASAFIIVPNASAATTPDMIQLSCNNAVYQGTHGTIIVRETGRWLVWYITMEPSTLNIGLWKVVLTLNGKVVQRYTRVNGTAQGPHASVLSQRSGQIFVVAAVLESAAEGTFYSVPNACRTSL